MCDTSVKVILKLAQIHEIMGDNDFNDLLLGFFLESELFDRLGEWLFDLFVVFI